MQVIKDKEQLKMNSNVDVEKQNLEIYTVIATEVKCRQFNWYFRYLYMVMLWAAVTIKNTSVVKPTNVLRTAVTKLNTNDLINMSEMTQLVVK